MIRGLDFETFGAVSLPVHGLDRYVNDPSFRPLLAVTAHREESGLLRLETFDFLFDEAGATQRLLDVSLNSEFVAHNASFERAVLKHLRMLGSPRDVRDSALIARGLGASSSLDAAAQQLLGRGKLPDGRRLIQKFSIPQPDGRVVVDDVDNWTNEDFEDWDTFIRYCELDAELSYDIHAAFGDLFLAEYGLETLTQNMNDHGWKVDLKLVRHMKELYELNVRYEENVFRGQYDQDEELNFRSTPQLRKWCEERGVRAKSFDELNVQKLLNQVNDRIRQMRTRGVLPTDPRLEGLIAVSAMLRTKQALGGSSLSKLSKILETVGEGDRLRGQYMHMGAGQTFRTSGRGVQMQNLKRIGGHPGNVDGPMSDWSNDELARNLRQVFTATQPGGELVVADYASVESRGLAWLAGAEWKLDEFRSGRDMYKVLAATMSDTTYDNVSPDERQLGKVGELSCGYGAGPGAVQRFAEKMGTILTPDQAAEIVYGWRDANPEITRFWSKLDQLLRTYLTLAPGRTASMTTGPDNILTVTLKKLERFKSSIFTGSLMPTRTPVSMMQLDLYVSGTYTMSRFFPGVFEDGRDICYMKASSLQQGPPWHDRWAKDGQTGRYKLYGGKLAGILTQSLCREIFFQGLSRLDDSLQRFSNVAIVGQFHDEIVVDWSPVEDASDISLAALKVQMKSVMSSSPGFPGLPLDASVQSSYRYTK